MTDTPRTALGDALRDIAPILVGVAPFGLIVGVAAVDAGLEAFQAYAVSPLVFAGAAQLAALDLIGRDGAVVVVILTPLVINARFVMYSASLAPWFRPASPSAKVAAAYLLTDQAFAVSIIRYTRRKEGTRVRMSYYFAAALALWLTWQVTSLVGVLVGAAIPAEWSLDFAVPLVFMALLVPAVVDRPTAVAAAVGAAVAVATTGLPFNLGLLSGAAAGIGAGYAAEALR